jgi:hypothetical protein
MLIDTNTALDALDEAIEWKLRGPLDQLFDAILSDLRRRVPALKQMPLAELDLLVADSKREFAHNRDGATWDMFTAFRCAIGGEE